MNVRVRMTVLPMMMVVRTIVEVFRRFRRTKKCADAIHTAETFGRENVIGWTVALDTSIQEEHSVTGGRRHVQVVGCHQDHMARSREASYDLHDDLCVRKIHPGQRLVQQQ